MANISGASLTQIQQRLRDTPAYHPFDADTFCDWAMEAGDIVTVRRGEESYQSPIHSSHLVWRGKQNMELNASGTKEREAIARVSKQKYARGGYGMRQQKSLYYEFYSEDGYLHGLFEVSESHMRSEFEDVANSLRGEFEVTASHLRGEFEDVANGLRGEFEVTASHLRSEFNDTANSLRGEFEVTASHLRGEFEDVANSLRGDFEVTASHLRGEFNDAANSLRGEFEVTASHLRGEFEDANNSLRGEFEVTAASLRAQFEDTSNSLRASIEAEAGRIGLVVEGYGADASVKRASLILAINNGTSSAHLDADQVYIGNQKSTTVISGKLNASDLTADLVTAKLALADNVNVKRLSLTNNGYIVLPTGDGNVSLTGASAVDIIKNLRIQLTGNTYTLQKVTLGDASWQDVGSFSRAISSARWEWTNGMPKVTLSPQDQSFTGRQITYGTPYQDSQDSNRWKMEIVEIDSSTTPPRYVTIPGRTIPLWNYLEAKTGTAKITANGTYTPGTGKIGFSEVVVDVDATVTGAWEQSNPQSSANPYNKYTVRKGSGAVALSETVNVTQSYDSTTHKYTATVSATNRSSVITAVTGTDAYDAGYAAVHLTGSWDKTVSSLTNNNRITISKTTSGSSNSLNYVISAAASIAYDSTTHKYTATAKAKVDGTQRGDDATSTGGTEAYDAGYGSAHLTGSWDKTSSGLTNNNRITISKTTSGSSNSLNYIVSAAASISYNSTTHKYTATAKAKVDGTQRGDDATATGGTDAYDDGYGAAHLTGSWDKTSSGLTNNNRITISKTTSGSSNSLKYVISAASSISYNSTTHKYTATAQAKVDGTQRGDNAIATGGTEAYDDGKKAVSVTIGRSSGSTTYNPLPAGGSVTIAAYKDGTSAATLTVSAPADTNRWISYENSDKSFQTYLSPGRYMGLKNGSDNTVVATWYVPDAWFYAGARPSGASNINEMTGNDYYLWLEYSSKPGVRTNTPVNATAWHINVPSSPATLDYIGVDPNRPADAYILNGDKQPYVITSAKTTYWFLIRAMSGTTILDSKYLGVGTNVSSGGGHNNAITFTRGALYAPNTYTWSAQVGTNVTGTATKFDFYY